MTDQITEMTRLLKAQAEKAALMEGIAKGELVPRSEALAELKRRRDRFVAKVLAIPAHLAARAAPADREQVRAAAQQIIEQYLMEIGPILDSKPSELTTD